MNAHTTPTYRCNQRIGQAPRWSDPSPKPAAPSREQVTSASWERPTQCIFFDPYWSAPSPPHLDPASHSHHYQRHLGSHKSQQHGTDLHSAVFLSLWLAMTPPHSLSHLLHTLVALSHSSSHSNVVQGATNHSDKGAAGLPTRPIAKVGQLSRGGGGRKLV